MVAPAKALVFVASVGVLSVKEEGNGLFAIAVVEKCYMLNAGSNQFKRYLSCFERYLS